MAVIAGVVQSVASPPPPPVFLQRGRSRFAVGCDLAQANDWTAICVVEHKAGVVDYNTEWERHCGIVTRPQVKMEYFRIVPDFRRDRSLAASRLSCAFPVVSASRTGRPLASTSA
jgi:hypothetical protein